MSSLNIESTCLIEHHPYKNICNIICNATCVMIIL